MDDVYYLDVPEEVSAWERVHSWKSSPCYSGLCTVKNVPIVYFHLIFQIVTEISEKDDYHIVYKSYHLHCESSGRLGQSVFEEQERTPRGNEWETRRSVDFCLGGGSYYFYLIDGTPVQQRNADRNNT